MSDENSKLIDEIIALKEKLDKIEEEKAELKDQNKELKDQNAKLLEKIEALEAEKLKNEPTHSAESNPSSQEILEDKSTNLEEKMVEGISVPIPNWLIEVLAWIKRVEMADSKLSTSNWTFKQLCWPKLHLNVKPHEVDYLHFWCEYNESAGIYQAKLTLREYRGYERIKVTIPIANVPPPKYITGFCEITIKFLDGQIMQFIDCIHPLLNGISLYFWQWLIPFHHSMEQISQYRHLFEILTRKAASFYSENLMDIFRFNPNTIGLMENIQSLKGFRINDEKEVDLFIEWLFKSHFDKMPKLIDFFLGNDAKFIFISKMKEQFIGSIQPSNFIIPLNLEPTDFPNFLMENDQTGEVLALYTNPNWLPWLNNSMRQFLVRHPKGEEHLRTVWEEQLTNQFDNLPKVYLFIKGIGEF